MLDSIEDYYVDKLVMLLLKVWMFYIVVVLLLIVMWIIGLLKVFLILFEMMLVFDNLFGLGINVCV